MKKRIWNLDVGLIMKKRGYNFGYKVILRKEEMEVLNVRSFGVEDI